MHKPSSSVCSSPAAAAIARPPGHADDLAGILGSETIVIEMERSIGAMIGALLPTTQSVGTQTCFLGTLFSWIWSEFDHATYLPFLAVFLARPNSLYEVTKPLLHS